MAKPRTYKRDAKGRFAGGGAKDPRGPVKVGRAGPRGGKTGTRTQQKKAKQAQQSRTKQFQSKTQASSARDAYKAAARGARLSQKGAVREGGSSGKRAGQQQRAQQNESRSKSRSYKKITTGAIDRSAARSLLASRSSVLRQASSAKGAYRRQLLGVAGRQAESISISGNAPNRTGRGNNQLTRAARRAASNYVRIEKQLAAATTSSAKKKLQKKLDTAFAAMASLPKTRLPR